MRWTILLLATLFNSYVFGQQRVAPTTVEVVPAVNLRYLQAGAEEKKTICITVDATMAGGPAVADVVMSGTANLLKERGYTVISEGCYISLRIAVPQGARVLAGYDAQGTVNASMRRSIGSFATFGLAPGIFEKSPPAAPPYVLTSRAHIVVGQGGTPTIVSVVASAPGASPDEAMPALLGKLAEGVASVFAP